MMDQLITRFLDQLEEALEISNAASITPFGGDVKHVYVAGMGGSGIGADFVANFIREECQVPYLVGKGYDIPNYIGNGSLCIVSSYSGNTEETLASFEQMLERGVRVICIASGGKIIQKAEELGLDYIKVPDSWPSPRACLGYSLVAQLSILQKIGLISDRAINEVQISIEPLRELQESIMFKAEKIAGFLHGKLPIIYGTERIAPVLVRFRQQINENAKKLCWHHTIPEMNHNELVGWRDKDNDLAVIFLRTKDDHERNQLRIDINKEIISHYTDTIIEVYARGQSQIQQCLYLVHLTDWVSWYLSQMRKMDAIEVDVIDFLKGELANV